MTFQWLDSKRCLSPGAGIIRNGWPSADGPAHDGPAHDGPAHDVPAPREYRARNPRGTHDVPAPREYRARSAPRMRGLIPGIDRVVMSQSAFESG